MAVQTITYDDKSYLNQNSEIADVNKINDTDMNEIKTVVNNNATETSTNSTNIANIINAEVYSTTEVKTNSVWIDGKPIYRKVIDIGNLPNNSSKSIATGIDFNYATLVKLYGFAKFSSNNICFPLPLASPAVLGYAIMINVDNSNNVVVSTGTDRSSYSGYVIIEYTKTTD